MLCRRPVIPPGERAAWAAEVRARWVLGMVLTNAGVVVRFGLDEELSEFPAAELPDVVRALDWILTPGGRSVAWRLRWRGYLLPRDVAAEVLDQLRVLELMTFAGLAAREYGYERETHAR